jgi:hypothetical protein
MIGILRTAFYGDIMHINLYSRKKVLTMAAKEANTFIRQEFEVFKGNVCNVVKQQGAFAFIKNVLLSGVVERYWDDGNYLNAFYLVAMVDYLSRLNDIPLYTKYNEIRHYQMEKRIFPLSISIEAAVMEKDPDDMIDDAIPEFLQFNIVEGDIFNVV